MTFTCLHENTELRSFECSPTEWATLASNSKVMGLTMACCNQPAVVKSDELGAQFFKHETDSVPCAFKHFISNESESHRYAKFLIAKKLFDLGWQVEAEQLDFESEPPTWIGAVRAAKGKAKVAVEVLWSYLPMDEVMSRQQAYKDAGIRCVWLMRAGTTTGQHSPLDHRDALAGDYSNSTKELPIFSLFVGDDGSMKVMNILTASQEYDCRDQIILDVSVFIEQLMTKHIVFESYDDGVNYLNIGVRERVCGSCQQNTNAVVTVQHFIKTYGNHCPISERKPIKDLPLGEVDIINNALSTSMSFKPLKPMLSMTEQSEYIASSCSECGAAMGRLFEEESAFDEMNTGKITQSKMLESSLPYKAHEFTNTGQWILHIDDDSPVDYMVVEFDDEEDE